VSLLLSTDADENILNKSNLKAVAIADKLGREKVAAVFRRWKPLGLQLPDKQGATGVRSTAYTLRASDAAQDVVEGLINKQLNSLDFKKDKKNSSGSRSMNISMITTLVRLATSYREANKLEDCANTREKIVELSKDVYGTKSIEYAAALNAFGEISMKLGRTSDACIAMKKATEVFARLEDYEDMDFSIALVNYALACMEYGKYDTAEKPLRRVVEIRKNMLGADHPDVASDLVRWQCAFYMYGYIYIFTFTEHTYICICIVCI
jgi:tetratricopeptide (TPR) repeat protein